LNEIVGTGKPAVAVNQEGAGSDFFQKFVADIFPMSYPSALTLAKHLALNQSDAPVRVLDLAAGSGVWGIALAIAEFLVNADRTGPVMPLLFAANMLVNTDEGDTYSFEEIQAWLTEAGFTDARLLESPGPSPLILAIKP
jgi:hypothetical protein